MTESECLELAKKHNVYLGVGYVSNGEALFRVKDLVSFTNATIEQATEIERLKIEIEVLDVAYGESIGDMIKERRARLAELTKGE